MSLIINAFNVVLYQPLFNALVFLYQHIPGNDFGVAVIVLTILIRFLLYPVMFKSLKSQKQMQDLQPKIQEIKRKLKDNKQEQSKAMMGLYQKEKINPFGGCLPLIIQMPILIALYRVFWKGFQPEQLNFLYSFIPSPGGIDPSFLGIIDLSQPSFLLAIIAGVAQFFQGKLLSPKVQQKGKNQTDQFSQMMQKQMIYFFPFFTVLILWKMPAAIGIYWIITALFSIFQQRIINKKHESAEL